MPSSSVPVWQNGTPQSMQRAPCSRSVVSGVVVELAASCATRSFGSAAESGGRTRVELHESGRLAHVGCCLLVLPARATSCEFSSNAAISASSSDRPVSRILLLRLEHSLVVVRHHFHELRHPAASQSARISCARSLPVYSACLRIIACTSSISSASSSLARLTISLLQLRRRSRRLRRARRRCRPTCRPRSSPGRPEHDHAAAGHVLAAVIAHALDHRVDAAVAHAEALARHAADVGLAAGRAVERDVADDDVFLGDEGRAVRRVDDDLAARQPLADVVVGVAFERQRDAARHERAEALPGRALEVQLDRVVRQPVGAVACASPRCRGSCRRRG